MAPSAVSTRRVRIFQLTLLLVLFSTLVSGIFHQRAVHLTEDPSVGGDGPRATVVVHHPRSLLAQSLEPLMAAALHSFSMIPSGAYPVSRQPLSLPYSTDSPYGTFSRFTATGRSRSDAYAQRPSQWSALPFNVGRYCDSQITADPEYQSCRADSALYWRAAEYNHDYRASTDPIRSCCYFWAVLSCFEDSVKRRCGDRTTLDYFKMRRNELRASLTYQPFGACSSYPHNAFRCSLQSWILILAFLILTAFILIIIISIVWVLVVRKRRKGADSASDVNNNDSRTRVKKASSGRSFNPFRTSQQAQQVRRVSPSRSVRIPDIERPPPSPHHLQYSTRQISL